MDIYIDNKCDSNIKEEKERKEVYDAGKEVTQ